MGVCTSKTEVFKVFYYIAPLIYLIYSVFPPIKSAFFTDFGGVTPTSGPFHGLIWIDVFITAVHHSYNRSYP